LVRLTERMGGVLTDCADALPCSFGDFTEALRSLSQALREAETFWRLRTSG
jgi:hypothetical protein